MSHCPSFASIAPELYESMTRSQVVFDDMAIVHQGQHVTLAGNTFHRMARIDLLQALHRHCREVGVATRVRAPVRRRRRSLPTAT